MQSTRQLLIAAVSALSVLPLAGFAASGNTFINGQSVYGQPAAQGAPVRVVDLASTDRLNVAYGESITFRSGAQQFSWTFDGLDRGSVDVNQIAPAGFAGKPFVVYAGRNPSNRLYSFPWGGGIRASRASIRGGAFDVAAARRV